MLLDKTPQRIVLVILLVCLAAMTLVTIRHFYLMLQQTSVIEDSALFAQMTRVLLDKNRTLYVDLWDHKPPGLFFFTAPSMLLFGNTLRALHVTSFMLVYLFAQGLSLLVYHYGRNRLLALIAAVVGAYYGSLIVYTRGIETTILMVALSFHAVYFIVASRGRSLWLLAAGILYSFAFITKQPIATDFIILVLLVLYYAAPHQRLRNLFIFGIGCAIGLLLFLLWSLAAGNLLQVWEYAFGANVQYAVGREQTWLLFDSGEWGTARRYLARETLPMITPLLGFALVVLFVFIRRKSESPLPVRIMLLWIITAIVGAMIGRALKITYFYQVLPVLLLISIVGIPLIYGLPRWVQSMVVMGFTAVVLLSPRGYLAGWEPVLNRATQSHNIEATAAYLRNHTTPDDCIWLWGYSHVILYYAERFTCAAPAHEGMVMVYDGFDITRHRIQYMENLLDHPPSFFVNTSAWSLFPMAQQYANRYFRERIPDLAIPVQRVDTSSWHLAEVHYEDLFTLIGVDRFQPTEICARQRLHYSMTWRVHQPPQHYYQMFIQLRDAETNTTLTGIDISPLQSYPTQDWTTPREIVLGDVYTLTVPDDLPASSYYVATGFYDTDTMERLEIWNDNQQSIGSETTIDSLTVSDTCDTTSD